MNNDTSLERSEAELYTETKKQVAKNYKRKLSDRKDKDLRIKPIVKRRDIPDDDITTIINLKRVTRYSDVEDLD